MNEQRGNLSSKNQKGPRSFKYFSSISWWQEILFWTPLFWSSLNHIWNLIYKKDKRRGALTPLPPRPQGALRHLHRTLELQRPHGPKPSIHAYPFQLQIPLPSKATKSFHQNWCWAGFVLAWGHTATRGPRWDWKLGFLTPSRFSSSFGWLCPMVPKTDCSVSALEAVVGSRMMIINLIALVLGQCLTQSCSVSVCGRKGFPASWSSHPWKQSLMGNSMNSSWVVLSDDCKQRHSAPHDFFP